MSPAHFADRKRGLHIAPELAEGDVARSHVDVATVADRIVVLRRGNKVAEKKTAETSPEEITGLITGAIERA